MKNLWWKYKYIILSLVLGLGVNEQVLAHHQTKMESYFCEFSDTSLNLEEQRLRREVLGDFNADVLSKKYGQVRFERGPGKYAFDDGKEAWYRKSVKLDRFYKPFAKDYIAPWKLIPEGETDVVTHRTL